MNAITEIYNLNTVDSALMTRDLETIIKNAEISFDSRQELISLKDQNNLEINLTSKKDPILCNHCKRTASNGVRCLGMCVADNDY